MRKRFGRNDIILIAVILIAAISMLFAWRYFGPGDGARVQVTVDGKVYGTYPLSKEQTVEIKDADGNVTNTLVISGGKADMVSADCPDHLCVDQRAISKEKESIICLPNKVVVTVVSGEESDIDSISK